MPHVIDLAAGAAPAAEAAGELRFVAPKDVGADSDTFLCRAYAPPGKQAVRVRVPGAAVVRATESRRGASTLHVRLARRATRFLLELDAHVVAVAQANAHDWFAVQMNPSLIEEYYHGSCAADRQHGLVARLVLDGPAPAACAAGARVDLELTLLGIQFRKQYFTAAWRVVSCEPTAPRGALGSLFADDDDGDGGPVPRGGGDEEEEGSDDDRDAGPLLDERVTMREELLARARARLAGLAAEAARVAAEAAEVRGAAEALEAAPPGDVRALEEAAERLG